MRDLARAVAGMTRRDRITSETIREITRQLAGAVANAEPLNVEERNFIHQVLLALADAKDVRKMLGIDPTKVGHRPRSSAAGEITRALDQRIPDVGITQAIEDVAAVLGKSVDAIRKTWERADQGRLERMIAMITELEGTTPAKIRKELGIPVRIGQ